MTYPILIDADGAVRKAFAVYGYPTNALIDREGKVRYTGAGFDSTALDQALQELMAKPVALDRSTPRRTGWLAADERLA